MLEIKNITKIYKTEGYTQHALDNVSINFREKEFVSILGPSGSGKSTLLNIIGGIDHYTDGDLVINGISTKKYHDSNWDSYRNNKIGFVFQSYNLITHQSILSNVELALTLSGVSRSERKKRAKEALKKVGLGDHLRKKPNQLSGGQMQRVAIARAIVNNPDIILADEPTGALDSETSVQIMEILKELAKEKLIIMVTHNNELAEQYSSRIIKLKDGKIIDDSMPFDGKGETIDTKPFVSKQMGLMTALSLSLNNLLTKKGRTILTAIAGSIGIIGIALILALSNGVKGYVDELEKEESGSFPIEIKKYTTKLDFSSLTNQSEEKIEKKSDKIYTKDDISDSVSSSEKKIHNNVEKLKEYLDKNEEIKKYATNIEYNYDINLQIYTSSNDSIIKANSFEQNGTETYLKNSFQELVSTDILEENFEVLSGNLPKNYNELVLVVNNENTIPLSVMYSIGLIDRQELANIKKSVDSGEKLNIKNYEFNLDEFVGKEYKLVYNPDYYVKENGVWNDKSNDIKFLKKLFDNGETLKIVGVIKVNKGSSLSSGYVGYTKDLIKYVADKTQDKQIIKEQIQNKSMNVFTGEKFDDIKTSYDLNATKLGIIDVDSPSVINIYSKNTDDKKEIKNILDEYNKDVNDEDKIVYSDSLESLVEGLKTIVRVIEIVLIAIIAISLIVSGIMISIITYISVLERTKEIGILRAIGASKRDIKRVFRAETIIEGFISGVLGIVVAFALCLLANTMVEYFADIKNIAVLPVLGSLILIAISTVLTLFAGSIPSSMASRKDPVESLRSE